MPLPDLLQWLAISQKTGILLLQRREIIKEIYFRLGKIVASASNDPREYFGQFLLSYGKIDEEDLMRAFQKQGETGIKLGRILVMDGLLHEDEVQRFLRIKAEETIYDLFLWDEGTFKFLQRRPGAGDPRPDPDGRHLHPHGGHAALRRVGAGSATSSPPPRRSCRSSPTPSRGPSSRTPSTTAWSSSWRARGASATSASCSTPPTSP